MYRPICFRLYDYICANKVMKKQFIVLVVLFVFFSSFAQNKVTTIIVIGNIHQAVPNYNSDTLLSILNKVKPDIILHEIDSSFFTKDFKFKSPSKENEQKASEKYLKNHPTTILRPFDFEGRNSYRREHGMVPTDNLATQLLDSLYTAGSLSTEHNSILTEFYALTDRLKTIADQPAKKFNNKSTDSIAKLRQDYQHKELIKIIDSRIEFANRFVIKPDGSRISYREGYRLWADFWDLRNRAMANNILAMATKYRGKTIVVNTGFLHRYYILSELKRLVEGKAIKVKEFYE